MLAAIALAQPLQIDFPNAVILFIQPFFTILTYAEIHDSGGQLHPDFQLLDAAMDGDLEGAVKAIEAGANANATDVDDTTPLYHALTRGHLPLAHFLVTAGADINATFGKRNHTLLHWAAENGSYGVCHFLLEYKANINAQRTDGATPLLLAAKGGHEYVVRLLLKHDAYISPRTSGNATARSAAQKQGHTSIVSMIDEAAVTRPGYLKDADNAFPSRSR